MTTENTATGADEPGDIDWDRYAAEVAEIFREDDPEAAAAAAADRQYQRWSAATRLRDRMFAEGASPASIAQALHESYPDIELSGYTYRPAPAAAPAEPVPAPMAAPVVVADDGDGGEDIESAVAPLSTGLQWVVGGVVLAVLALAGLGFVVSFDTQTGAVEPYFGPYAPLVPLAIDLGIVVFAALNLVLARLNMSIMWLRAVPWVLTAMTLYINLSAHHELVARVAHVALPGMWIVASEVGTHVLRLRAGLEAGTRTESLGLVRWVLDPISTARLWRHMRLWGLKTATEARASEARRLEARAALHARYGCMWRVKTPIQLRTAYRLRRLDAEAVYTWTPPVIVAAVPGAVLDEATEGGREDSAEATAKDTVKDAREDGTEDTVKDTREDSAGDASEDGREDTAKDSTEDGAKDVPESGVKRPRRPRKDTAKGRRGGKAIDPKSASDEDLAAHLNTVVGPAERVSIRRAVAELSIGKDRAGRVIAKLDELRAQATV